MGSNLTVFEERDLCIRADAEQVRDARDWAAAAARDFGLGTDDCYQVKLAVSEIVSNAIEHGSRTAEDRIRISARACREGLVFEVLDSGVFRGAGERSEELAERGRGLELVALIMDEVDLIPGERGTLMRFVKRLRQRGRS